MIFVFWYCLTTQSANKNHSPEVTNWPSFDVCFFSADKKFFKQSTIFVNCWRNPVLWLAEETVYTWHDMTDLLKFSLYKEQTTLWDPDDKSYWNRHKKIRKCWIRHFCCTCWQKLSDKSRSLNDKLFFLIRWCLSANINKKLSSVFSPINYLLV